ncbi:hypothetical protein KDX16_19835 [Burkholderia vietnamiensis]|uniref:hypothetical protein n=1 Tax=Burkholderia vietnamiensis TaxID=60552 RepID=UPI001B93F4A2|nr:hypothetical protein [Burkholderia vietnamiensis]MBR7918039.1 hypothetical protein [Burkholderia vietnamiensis]
MTDATNETAPKRARKKARDDDPQGHLHGLLDRFLENPTNRFHVESLVSGLVGYELRARLAALPFPEGGCVVEPEQVQA